MHYLLVWDGTTEREALLPAGTLTVGRLSSNDIAVAAEDVSRQHAQLRVDGPAVEVRDLGTANGTFVARASDLRGAALSRIAAETWTRLQPGDRVKLGTAAWLEVRETVGWRPAAEGPASAAAPLAGRLPTLTPSHPGVMLAVGLCQLLRETLLHDDPADAATRCVHGLLGMVPSARSAWLLRRGDAGFEGEIRAGRDDEGMPPLAEALASEALEDPAAIRWAEGGTHQPALLACAAGDTVLVLALGDATTLPAAEVIHVLRAASALLARLARGAAGGAITSDVPTRTASGPRAGEDPSRHYGGRVPSPQFRDLLERAARMASGTGPVLVVGETGVGKELIAEFLHAASGRKGRFVEASVGALPSTLVESELFGHVKGAFTDATSNRTGLMPLADGGTLFLDEIGEVPLDVQPKLLRALETRTVRPVGSNEAAAYDALVVAATNRDLREEVRAGRFREDLYFRLFQFEVRVPPLRERPGDVAVLARHFLSQVAPGRSLDVRALDWLVRQPWRGNVRELKAVIERAARMHDATVLRPEHFGAAPDGAATVTIEGMPLNWRDASHAFEHAWCAAILAAAEGRIGEAATLAGLHRSNLRAKLKNHGLSGDRDAGDEGD